MSSAISLKDVWASYDGKPALSGITLDIPKQRITAVIGPSGCGKSTLLRCMNGLLSEEPSASMGGSITLDGKDTRSLQSDDLRRRIGLVFQTPAPFPFSIYRNMAYAPQYYGLHDKSKLDRLVEEKLRLAGLYGEVSGELGKNALKLSGGQQQRLCIARALTVEPEILLLDEPCSALDVKSTKTIEELLLRLKEDYTVVIVTHNLAQARRISDNVVFLYEGRLIEHGPVESLFTNPREEETRSFLGGIFG
ncbi:MAG: phosphate ABC transporter ATP-binding protein [Clostridiaceae bacterium]|nr:phosphate ABC transporter ATP-binding protein [Clostridiaceae bacterium]